MLLLRIAILFGFNSANFVISEADSIVQVPVDITGDLGAFLFNLTVNGSIESGSASGTSIR